MDERLQKPAALDRARVDDGQHILDRVNAARRYEVRRYPPTPALEAFVAHHWIIRWDLEVDEPYTTEVLGFPSVNLVFHAGGPQLSGVTTRRFAYQLSGRGVVVGVMFRPGGFAPFFSRPVSELTDRVLPASTIFPAADDVFNARLCAVPDDQAAIEHTEALLLAREPVPEPRVQLLEEIIAAAASSAATATVGSLARQFAMSERSVQQLFRTYVGVGLKWVLMRYRMIQAAEHASTSPAPNWAAIAADLGFSDQAHFANEFRAVIGQTPSRYARSLQHR